MHFGLELLRNFIIHLVCIIDITPTSAYESTYRLRDDDDDLTCSTIIEDFTFDGFLNPRLSVTG